MVKGIEQSTKPTLKTVDADAIDETRQTWDEPEPRRGVPGAYPFIHTYESESGIVREIDDTNANPRITEYHPAGTFYEILPDGDKVTKVSGDNYEIIIASDNILVRGTRTTTIEGDCRHLVKGNYIVEVMGDYNLKVHGNRNTKVTKNDNMEVEKPIYPSAMVYDWELIKNKKEVIEEAKVIDSLPKEQIESSSKIKELLMQKIKSTNRQIKDIKEKDFV
jgi:hypothetical protein